MPSKEEKKESKDSGHAEKRSAKALEKPAKEAGKELHDKHPSGEKPSQRRQEKRKPKRIRERSRQDFVELKPKEVEEAIVHLANEGHSASEIGMILRDQYGVPEASKVTGKKVSAILKEHGLLAAIPEDLMSLIRKSVVLRQHLGKNRKDMSAKRGLMLTVSKIRALEKYYKRKGSLPEKWRYSAETAELLAK